MFIVDGRLITEKFSHFTWEQCGPWPVFACYTLEFDLKLREKHRNNLKVVEKIQEGTIPCVDMAAFKGS